MRLPIGQSAAVGRPFIDLTPEIVSAILRTIEAGWELALQRPEVAPTAGEVAITECLRDAMRDALRLQRLPWRKTMAILPGTESRSRAGMTAPDGRTDIPILLWVVQIRTGEHDPHAIIECKRVAEGNAGLTREYVVEGIGRFTTGKYSENHAHGFMIGYVLSGSCSKVVGEINTYLTTHTRTAETLAPAAGGSEGGRWDSRHPRTSGADPIMLHHIMASIL